MMDIIKKVVEEKLLCEIYSNCDDLNTFAVGYILEYDDDFILYKSVDKYGNDDGLYCRAIDTVVKIQYATKYLCALLYLIQDKRFELVDKFNGNLLYNILNYALQNKFICNIELCDDDSSTEFGLVSSLFQDSPYVGFSVVDGYGQKDGEASINNNDISCVSLLTLDTKRVQILFSEYKKINL